MPLDRVIAPHLLEDLPRPVAEVLEEVVATLLQVARLGRGFSRSR